MYSGGVSLTIDLNTGWKASPYAAFSGERNFRPSRSAQKLALFRDQSCSQYKVEMSGDTPDFSIEPEGGMTPPSRFTYKGRQVEIVPPDTGHLIGNYWQIKIDGVLQGDLLFSSARMATNEAAALIDRQEE
jgi:hypothetical protein